MFENLTKYLSMDKWNRELLDKYCREYSVGIVGFNPPSEETLVGSQLKGFPIFVHTNVRLKVVSIIITVGHNYNFLHLQNAALNAASPVLRLTRAGETAWGSLPGDDWTVFTPNHSTYEPLAWASPHSNLPSPFVSERGASKLLTTVVQDHGTFDGIQRIIFGSGLRFWLHRLLFLDALSYLSHGQLSLSLNRYMMIDVDDIFVGERGTRLTPDDVEV